MARGNVGAIKLQGFAGMIPAIDPRLLPKEAAADSENVWYYNGALRGLVEEKSVFELLDPGNTRTVFRIPIAATNFSSFDDSFWLEFAETDISVVKSPVAEQTDPSFYWASGVGVPMYNTKSRIAASDPPLKLGIPTPVVAPGVAPVGGAPPTENRAYVYTWVSQFGEEGPPSPATNVVGNIDATWDVTMTAPTGADTTDRVLTHTNIYRTVTASDGTATFFFVAQVPIATLAYNDVLSDTLVTAQGELESTYWTPPPAGLQGICALPNGMLAGWVGEEIWFCEPYRPHAWPIQYQIATEYDIIAMAGAGQSLLIGTAGFPYFATGVNPGSMVLSRIPSAEPCVSRGSMCATQFGAFYASPNGLIFLSALGTVQNTTRNTITKDKWQELLVLKQIRAALLNGAYFIYCGVQQAAFEETAFENTAFQLEDDTGTRTGALIEVQEPHVGFTRLFADVTVFNVLQDPWSGEVLLVGDTDVFWMDLTNKSQQEYTWLSKIFVLPYPTNLSAAEIEYEPPPDGTTAVGTIKAFAWNNGAAPKLVLTKTIPASNQVFRLPTGFKANCYQFEISGNLQIKSFAFGATVDDLKAA